MNAEARESFARFVAEHSDSLMRLAYVLAGDQHSAEDLLQSALARTAARWRHVKSSPEAYVRKAMYNEQVSRWRRGRESVMADLPESGVGDRSDEVDLKLALERALLALPPRKRAVLVLRYYQDLPEKQVAEILGCSVGTVRSQTHKAITRLREQVPGLAVRLEEVEGAR